MYAKFFGLHEKPFSITPDPRYLFMSERHGEGLAHLVYGVTESGGFIQLTGEVGTGKTTLVRTLLGQIPAEVDIALILNPQLTAVEFLTAICEELKMPLPVDRHSTKALVDTLNQYLLRAHALGRRTILMIDEAQNLDDEVLEQLRLLTNLETAKQKLLQIILIAQPELRNKLSQEHLRQLKQRVTGRYHLEPLSRDEAYQYIDHRLKVAGALGEIFDAGAKSEVYRLSGGIPRVINVICDRAMLGGYSRETRTIDKGMVRRAAAEVSGQKLTPLLLKWGLPSVAVLIIGAIVFTIWDRLQDVPENSPETVSVPLKSGEESVVAATPIEVASAGRDVRDSSGTGSTSLDARLQSGVFPNNSDSAMAALTELWGVDYDSSEGPGCAQVEAAGLSCLFQRGTMNVLRQLDRPAILTLTDRNGKSHQAVLLAADDETAELYIGANELKVPLGDISPLWFGQYMLIWRPPLGSTDSIRPGTRTDKVRWLRDSLASIDATYQPGEADAEYFDTDLENQLKEFQRQNRLQVDGLAGQQTQIIINTRLAVDGTPTLSGAR